MQHQIEINEIVTTSIKKGIEEGLNQVEKKKKPLLMELAPILVTVIVAILSMVGTFVTGYLNAREQHNLMEINLRKEYEFERRKHVESLFCEIRNEKNAAAIPGKIESLALYKKEAIPYLTLLKRIYSSRPAAGPVKDSIQNALGFVYMPNQPNLSGVIFYRYSDDNTKEPTGRTSYDYSDFSGINLSRASFRRCYLNKAVFKSSIMAHAILQDTDLRGADFTGADLYGADFRGAQLDGVIGFNKAIDLNKAKFSPEQLLDAYEDYLGNQGIFKDVQRDTIDKLMKKHKEELQKMYIDKNMLDRMNRCGLNKIISE